MDGPVPASIPKAVSPFLARAKELAKRDPVISYWCKFKAAQLALDQIPNDTQGRQFLEELMDDLENTKAEMADNELITDDVAGSAYISNFAAKVFEGADKVDREGKATRLTAKEFLAASVFFDVLTIFGALETDVSEKITYAKWKATSIAKAIREGRPPSPGPAGSIKAEDGEEGLPNLPSEVPEENEFTPVAPSQQHTAEISKATTVDLTGDDDEESTLPKQEFELPSVPEDGTVDPEIPDNSLPSVPSDAWSHPGIAGPPQIPIQFSRPQVPTFDPSAASQPPPVQPSAPLLPSQPPVQPQTQPSAPVLPPAPLPNASKTNGSHATTTINDDGDDDWKPAPSDVDPTTIAQAQKHAKWAISALNYEDLDTARNELRTALRLIGG